MQGPGLKTLKEQEVAIDVSMFVKDLNPKAVGFLALLMVKDAQMAFSRSPPFVQQQKYDSPWLAVSFIHSFIHSFVHLVFSYYPLLIL